MRKRYGVITALEERMRGPRPIGPLYLSWSVWISLLLFFFLIPNRPALAQEAGQIVSVLGAIEVMREGRWQPIGTGETLAVGEVIRTGADGRVAVQLANGSQLKINANSHLELKQIAPGEGLIPTKTHPLRNILRLLSGEIWVRGNAEPLEIQTIPVIATIRGTEFNLAVGPSDFARLAVLDGLVEFSNPQGSELVAANEQATAKLGEPPRKTVLLNPLDAVQWSLYYPDPAGDRAERERAGRADPRSPRYWTWAARQHLLRGQVPDARRALDRALALDPNDARAYSLRAAVELVQNRKAEARTDAERAVAADPAAPEAHLTLSWVQQAEFDLDGALASARKAVQLAPDDPQALIQESRLLFGMGRTREATKVAEKARQRAPKDALVNSTWGFLQLARGRVKEADQAFQEAIAQDSTLGEPHLGLGLALFRRNQTEAAVEEMRKATLLEPKVSLYNSYLGKAYYETKDDRLAQKYFEAAKRLDPRDPTPHFYDAIRRQSVNRPVEAVQELQKSIELNDDRAVYRSRLLLDEDLAARDAALGKIYNEVGFGQLGQQEGSKSATLDPANYSAHRLLADSYSTLTRHESARVSELLQSQLLQPINITPIQPQLSETKLLIFQGAGPTTPSLYEYNPLFVRDHATLFASGIAGNNDTLGDELILSGIADRLSYSLGQFHYETNGFRENNDLQHDVYNLFAQIALAPKLSLQAEYRGRETNQGDLKLSYEPEDKFSRSIRRKIDEDSYRIGAHFAPTPGSDILFSLTQADRNQKVSSLTPTTAGIFNQNNILNSNGYDLQLQYLFRADRFNITAGLGTYNVDSDLSLQLEAIPCPFRSCEVNQPLDGQQDEAYLYANIGLVDNLILTTGISYVSIEDGLVDFKKFNPKLGAEWNINDHIRLRLASFETVKRSLIFERTLEPTQVTGFNQIFDDFNGTKSERHGIGIDVNFTNNFYGGIELSKRHLDVPRTFTTTTTQEVLFEEQNEDLYRAYLYWTPTLNWAIGARYEFEQFGREPVVNSRGRIAEELLPTKVETTTIPLTLRYFQPAGFFAQLETSYVRQKVDLSPRSNAATDHDDFVVIDTGVGYRFPKRRGFISLEINNLLDEEFLFQDVNIQTAEPSEPRYIPDRTIVGRIMVKF